MTREQLEHLIRAAAVIADDEEIVVIVEVEPEIREAARGAIERAFRGEG